MSHCRFVALASTAGVLVTLVGAGMAESAVTPPLCFGQQATIYRGSGYPGTNTAKANDPMTITGTSGNDVIYAANGNDVIDGAGGDDLICGVDGMDKIRGGAGNDRIFGSQGDDDLGGQIGDDEVIGGPGNDRVNGGAGNDRVRGGDGNDILNGGDGDDSVYGGNDDDVLAGGDGIDNCQGNSGNDVLTSNGGCESPPSADLVTNNTEASTAAGDRAVVAAAESDGTSWADGAGVNPATETNPAAAFLPSTTGGTSNDVEGGNVTAEGDV
jgi:Ca2+-binding RTX toxin-like protein